MWSSPIDNIDVAESSKERWLSEDNKQPISLAFVLDASNSNTTTITCDNTSSLFHESHDEETSPYLDEDEPLESFLDHPDLFGSFGDFSLNGNDEDPDESSSVQAMTKPQEEEFAVLRRPPTAILAKGFSWNRAKVVRMLSARSLMLEEESGEDEDISVVHSVSTLSTHQSTDTVRVDVPGEHDPDLATQLSQMSNAELAACFNEMRNEVIQYERKRAKARKLGHSSKEKKSKSRPSSSSDHKKSSENQSSRSLDSSKVKVKKERSHRKKRESKEDEIDDARSSHM